MRGINTTLCSLRGEPEGRRQPSTLESLHWCSAMISLLSQMSGLYEAPEDIFNAQDHCLRPERACRNVTNKPTTSDLVHPCRHGREYLAVPDQTEFAVAHGI